ncbi:hypothetical protein JCM1840_000106 [Sporobolomyces johnsonii]
MSNASEILFGTYAANPGSNVFEIVQKALYPKVFAVTPQSYLIQLWVIIGLYCVEIALFVFALLLRTYKQRRFPVFRLSSTPRGTYIVPHFALAWQLMFCIGRVMFLVYAYRLALNHETGNTTGYVLWIILAWIPTRFRLALKAFYPLNAQLLADAAAFSPTDPPAQVQQQLAALVEPFQAFLDRHRSFDIAWRAGWAVWLFAMSALLVIWTAAGSTYSRRLSRELRDVQHEYAAFRHVSRPSAGRPRSPPASMKQLRRAYRDMVFASFVIVLGGAVYAGDSLFLLVSGSARAFQSTRYQTATLLALYYPVIAGIPLSILAASRAAELKRSPDVVALGGMTSQDTPSSPSVA